MNTQKISQLANIINTLSQKKRQQDCRLQELQRSDHEEAEEELVFTAEVSRGSPRLDFYSIQNTLDDFKHLLDNPSNTSLFYRRDLIQVEDMEDCRIEFKEEREGIAWEDEDEDVIYMQFYCYVKKYGENLDKEIEELKESILELESSIKNKEDDLRFEINRGEGNENTLQD